MRKVGLGIFVAVFVVLAMLVALSQSGFVRRPIFGDAAADEAVREYVMAEELPANVPDASSSELTGWKQRLLLPRRPGQVIVVGSKTLSAIAVNYEDGRGERRTYNSADHTTNLSVRMAPGKLYVYRRVTWLWTEYRLAVFDIYKAQNVGDFLVDPKVIK